MNTGQKKYKYITYRKSRGNYQVTFPIVVPSSTAGDAVKRMKITRQATTLEEALQIREDIARLYRVDVHLLDDIQQAAKAETTERHRFQQDFTFWFDSMKEPLLAPSSRYKYVRAAELIKMTFTGKYVEDVTREMILALLKSAAEQATRKHAALCLTILKQFFVYEGIPCPASDMKVTAVTAKYKKKEALTQSEVKKILRYIEKNHHDKAFLFQMFFLTGCRRGELLGLTWKYVDFDNNRIQIKKTLVKDDYNRRIVLQDRTKTAAGARYVYLPAAAMKRLHFWKIIRDYQGIGTPSDFVFLNRNRRPYHPDDISEYFRRARVAVGIKKHVSLHSARHTFATNLASRGIPLYIIQALGGWQSTDIIQETYLHIDTERVQDFISKSHIFDDLP